MSKIIEDRKLLDNLLANLVELDNLEVEAGVISSKRHPNFEGTVATLGAFYEFGFERKHPKTGKLSKVEAPFISPVDYSDHKYITKEFSKLLPEMTKRGNVAKKFMEEIGKQMSVDYKAYIESDSVQYTVNGQYVPKSDGTRLIDTSTLVESITYNLKED